MKIHDLIYQLQRLAKEHGNLDVRAAFTCSSEASISSVHFVKEGELPSAVPEGTATENFPERFVIECRLVDPND